MGVTRRAVLASAAAVRAGMRAARRRRSRMVGPGPYSRMVLAVRQTGTTLTIEMTTGAGLRIGELAARFPDGTRVPLAHPTATSLPHAGARRDTGPLGGGFDGIRYEAELDLTDLARQVRARALLDHVPPAVSLDVAVTSAQQRPPRYATLIEQVTDDPAMVRYWAPLGRFRQTRIEIADRFEVGDGDGDGRGDGDGDGDDAGCGDGVGDGLTARVRVTRLGHLMVSFDACGGEEAAVDTRGISLDGPTLTVTGVVRGGSPEIGGAQLELVGRDVPIGVAGEASLALDETATQRTYGRRCYDFTASLDLRDLVIPRGTLPPHAIADLWLAVRPTVGADPVRRRIGRVPFEQRHTVSPTRITRQGTVLEVVPYFTFKGRNASVMLDRFDLAAYRYMEDRLRSAGPRSVTRRRAATRPAAAETRPGVTEPPATRPGAGQVWIVGERPETAQDNGLELFRYLRTERRDIDAYYVITRDSPDRHRLADLDHVITFGSIEHIDLSLRADRIVTTHHADYLYPSRTPRFQRRVTAARVFLQHGVMGTKWMVPNYGKFGTGFVTDLFCVSSAREREYIIHDFGYRPEEVVVTGLARFDSLFAGDVARRPGHVLVAPTWRDWLTDTAAFETSDYLAQWRGLLEDPRLADTIHRHRGRVVLYLHSNMRKYAEHFRIDGVELVGPGEARLQDLVKESSVLVTDYSSTGFDAAFLDRPVIYFQFDRARFLGPSGSHLHLDDELPGTVTHSADDTLMRLDTVLRDGFSLEPEYRRRAERFRDHHDRNNCARIVDAVIGARRHANRIEGIRRLDAVHTVERRVRRSGFYFPLMRRAYRMMRLLPMDPDTIVFEAGIGRQFADSPRAIYEELVTRGDPRRRVWIYPRTLPVDDPQLVVVPRFSPRYFYYLARAKYWVNNQNFPHYVTRRRRGVYVQTWHGTPIKRMLHDLDRVVGRDPGYRRRVTQSIAQWSVLLSPSPYATEAFRSAFRYRGPVLEEGYPRNDVLVGADAAARRRAMRDRLGIRDHQRVLLYAPTFRDNQKKRGAFSFTLPFDLDRFAARFGPDTILLLRMHLLVAEATTISDAARPTVKDVSAQPDIADLYLAADALVTDYSSVMFDFAITGKPMIFYPYDLEEYRDEVRGFYLDYDTDLPGPIVRTEDDLFAAIEGLDMADGAVHPDVRAFAARFAPLDDGHAAGRVVDAVFGETR